MKIALIGYGNMAEALGSGWVRKHELYVGGRNANKALALAEKLGGDTRHGSEAGAAAFGDVIVLATQHEAVFNAMAAAGGPDTLAGKILLDINNPVNIFDGDFLPKTFDGKSLAEAIAAYAPAARVVAVELDFVEPFLSLGKFLNRECIHGLDETDLCFW